MERFEIIASSVKVNRNRNKLISLLNKLEIDIDYCCDSENLSIYTYPEKASSLTKLGYRLIRPKISGIYQISDYHDQVRLLKSLNQFQEKYPAICELETIGKSVKGVDLYMFRISSNKLPRYQKPNFLWIGKYAWR